MSKTDLQPAQQNLPAVREEPGLLDIIRELAVDSRVDVAKLAGLMQLQERAEEKAAEREFNAAFARLQPQLPRVQKNGKIDLGKGKPLSFARYEDIDTAVRPLLASEGFSVSFTSPPDSAGIKIVCTLAHIAGHSKMSEITLPPDAGPGRNTLQAIGSSRSYAKRYLLCDLLNIVTEGIDDDAHSIGFVSQQQADAILDLLAELGIDKDPARQSKFLEYMGAKSVSEIHARDFKRAVTALESARRKGN
jgi:hypothetical protein